MRKTNAGSIAAIVLFIIVALLSPFLADRLDASGENTYSPPIPQPEIDRDFNSVRQMVEAGMPVLIAFPWSESGMAVLDDYGYLNVEADDLIQSNDFVRVACIGLKNDAASGEDVFICGPFYGRWVGENNDNLYSFDAGYIRNFMIRAIDMEMIFRYGGYAIR